MSLGTRRALIRFLMFGIWGLAFEVCGTGIPRWWEQGEPVMRGYSSIWMLPIYGMLGLLVAPIANPLKARRVPYVFRAAVYMLGFFVIEYLSGMLYLAVGLNVQGGNKYEAVWDYTGAAYNLHGQIQASFIPVWYVTGLMVEPLYRWVDTAATALALGFRADTLPSAAALTQDAENSVK
jgi:hypothetical protein